MIVTLVFVGILLLGFIISFLVFSTKINKRKKLCKEWKIGDKIILNYLSSAHSALIKSNLGYATLSGCNLEYVFVTIGDLVYRIKWDEVENNKSYNWRSDYEKCESLMGTKPTFNPEIKEDNNTSGKIDGKPIELLTEVECQVYLKQALDNEDFELAEKIRQQMQKFR